MRLRVQNINSLDLCDAAAKGDIDCVESLLASGVGPNARWDDLTAAADDDDWASSEKNARPPLPFREPTEMPALRRATRDWEVTYPDKQTTTRITTALLQHGADPFALFREPIYTHRDLPLFPGETKDAQFDSEESDLVWLKIYRRTVLDRKLQLHRRQQRLAQAAPAHQTDQCMTICEKDYRYGTEWETQLPHQYGVYSVLHSLLEDGVFVQPVLDFFGDTLDIERRDPQGLTLFLSACRSTLGLDAAIDCTCKGLSRSVNFLGLYENPYPQAEHP